jgi:C_GCAxxG_C_C family probable redox protein
MTEPPRELKTKVEELAGRQWDMDAINARYERMAANGIPPKTLDPAELAANREQILDRVQRRAEEYNFLAHNCPQGTAMALLEEFGIGNMEVIKALCPFPGIGGTGEICGGISGSLVAFGLFFGSNDVRDLEGDGRAIMMAQQFIADFEDQLGYITCADIQEHVVFDRNMDPGASQENMEAFGKAKGFEKCGLAPGIGARIAAGYMIDSIINNP